MVVQEIDLVDIEAKDYLLGVTLLTGRTVHYLVIWGVNAKISRSVVIVRAHFTSEGPRSLLDSPRS